MEPRILSFSEIGFHGNRFLHEQLSSLLFGASGAALERKRKESRSLHVTVNGSHVI